ncbi:MAG: MauE/DoxX family redox-associated membrane protein [Solirubrobacterales bacterium]
MIEAVVRIVLASTLVAAGVLKLGSPSAARASLATFGIRGPRSASLALFALVSAELGLAAGVVAGIGVAAYAAAALMLAFAGALALALARGRAGSPCACFGARSKVTPLALGRTILLAAAFAALPQIDSAEPATDQWLAIGLGVSLLACGALAAALLALAREVGMLRLQAGSQGALEIADEGPELGLPAPQLADRLRKGGAELGLAIFVSDGCHVCRTLAPAIDSLASEPGLAVGVFEEVGDADLWRALEIPGSPFAVAADLDGTVLAKGTFNNLAQLESVAATAARRRSAAESVLNEAPVHA